MIKPFVFAVDQKVTRFEVLEENDRSGVVDDCLQPLFARAQRLLRSLAARDIPDKTSEETPAIPDVISKRDFDWELLTAFMQAGELDRPPINVSLAFGDESL